MGKILGLGKLIWRNLDKIEQIIELIKSLEGKKAE